MANHQAKAKETKKRQETTTEDRYEEAIPEATGAAAGLATGAAIGAMVAGPLGAALGAAVAGPIGAALGKATDYDEAEPTFREHWESEHRDQVDWDHASHAYRYGWNSHDKDRYHSIADYEKARPELKRSWNQKGRFDEMESMVRTGWEGRLRQRIEAGDEAILPVVEERLKVGKRQVETGGVKVRSHVEETPVEQQVRLHEEEVHVRRRPVDRPVRAGDAALVEGELELTETAEEAVVAKEARVVEEVVLEKQGRDRTQTVRDTVRRTDVDVVETDAPEFQTYDTEFRADHRTRFAGRGLTYAQATPAYRYGWDLARASRANDRWERIEPQARRHWEERNPGTWTQFKDAIQHAWERVRGER